MINMILRCPHQWEMLKTYGPMPPGVAAISGSSVHSAAEHNHIQKVKSGKDEPLSVLQDCAIESFTNRLYDEGIFLLEKERPYLKRIITDAEQRTLTCTQIYHQHVAPKIQPVEAYTEKELMVDIGLDMNLGAQFDTGDAQDNLYDLKTSVSKYQSEYIKKAIQPTHYSLIYKELTGRYPTFHTEVLVEDGTYQPLQDTKTEADFERHIRICEVVIKVIQSGLFPPCCPDPKISWWCCPRWCGWYHLCEYATQGI